MKWYDSLIKKIQNYGNNIFLYDLDGLLDDRNFLRDLSINYEIFKYEKDEDFFRFKTSKSQSKLIYSNTDIRRSFIKNPLFISINDVFENLNHSIMRNTDVSFYQKIFDYCVESESHNLTISPENTENIIFQSVWNIDLGMLFNPTNNLKVALDYLINKRRLDDSIIQIISEKIGVDLRSLVSDDNKIKDWVESLILNFMDENQFNHKFDLSDNLIQFYFTELDLDSTKISEKIDENLLNKYPWLIKFKLDSDSDDLIVKKIQSDVSELEMYYDKIYYDNKIDQNDLDNIFNLSKKFFKILYQIQINELNLIDFNISEIYKKINHLFKSILNEGVYTSLFNYSYKNKPYTVDRVLDFINLNFKEDNIALIVMDGMSYDEWFILKKYLDSFKIKELESFSILPSITSFSRTSIFTGKTPNRFLDENNKVPYNSEEKGFKQYFQSKKIDENDILFGHIDLNNEYVKNKKEIIEFEYLKGYKVMGLICNLFDDESHSIQIFGENKSNLYKNIDSAINSSKLVDLLKTLNDEGYKIILTADHGNIYCEGNEIKENKMLQFETKSTRCFIYDNESLADKIVNENPNECFKWNYNLLSNNLFLVFSTEGFFGKGFSITHGSYMPEECIVPVIILE